MIRLHLNAFEDIFSKVVRKNNWRKKMIVKRLSILVILFLIAITMLTACGGSSLVGEWELQSNSSDKDYLEFFSDGRVRCTRGNMVGTWSTNDNRLLLDGVSSRFQGSWTYEISNNTLSLNDNPGRYDAILTRVR